MKDKKNKEQKVETAGFVTLPETHPTQLFRSRPVTTNRLREGYGYFSLGKCEPESVAMRFANIQIETKRPNWSGMSLKRYFYGVSKMKRWMWWKKVPCLIPVLTEAQEEGPSFETFPPLPGREFLFHICGLRRLERLGMLEFFEIDGQHYIVPTAKYLLLLEKGIAWVEGCIAKQEKFRQRQLNKKKKK